MAAAGADVRDDRERGDQGSDSDRDVDEEDPAPVDVRDDRPTGRGSGDGGESSDASPDSEGRSASLRRKQRRDDRKRLRRQDRAADTLEDASRNQLVGVLRKATQRGGDREYEETDREKIALAVEVAEPAGGDQQHCI